MELCIDGCIDTVYFKSGQSQIFYSNRSNLMAGVEMYVLFVAHLSQNQSGYICRDVMASSL